MTYPEECPTCEVPYIVVGDVTKYYACPKCHHAKEPINPIDWIEPLDLTKTTTSRDELRWMEREIMMENKINEIITKLNKHSELLK